MRILTAAVFALWASSLPAQQGGLLSLDSTQDARKWEAVGRLEIAGSAFCTGALIEPTLVLTAAHCLFDPATGAPVPVDDIQFLAGWRNGRAAAYRRIKRAVAHPQYTFSGPADTDRVRNDVALIELQHPIRNTTIKPYKTAQHPEPGDKVGVVSYAHDRSEAPSLQELCNVIARKDAVFILSCEVDFGSSGSPVFSFDGGAPQIVSVVSAKAEANGEPVSLAMSLEEPLEELRQVFALGDDLGAGLETMSAGTRRKTGAKFVKP